MVLLLGLVPEAYNILEGLMFKCRRKRVQMRPQNAQFPDEAYVILLGTVARTFTSIY
jgi:hypothetical protein